MRIQILFVLFFAAFVAGIRASGSTRESLCEGFLPENDMRIPESALVQSGLTHAQFDEILDRIAREYTNDIAALGGRLVIERKWSNATVNAYADREGANWILSMYGGMARHPLIDYDGFMAIACHEVGHHLGGAPIFKGEPWGTVEGGADYYAALKCLRRVFRGDDNEKILGMRKLDPIAIASCRTTFAGKQDQLLCVRAAMAGLTLGAVAADLDQVKVPRLDTPDKRRVAVTEEDHPEAQCRLDTYFEGALCRVPWAQPLSSGNYRVGSCADAKIYARGLRPRCWFKP